MSIKMTVFEINEKVKAGEVVAIPASYMGTFMVEAENHLEGENRFKMEVIKGKCFIGPSELEGKGWQMAKAQAA